MWCCWRNAKKKNTCILFKFSDCLFLFLCVFSLKYIFKSWHTEYWKKQTYFTCRTFCFFTFKSSHMTFNFCRWPVNAGCFLLSVTVDSHLICPAERDATDRGQLDRTGDKRHRSCQGGVHGWALSETLSDRRPSRSHGEKRCTSFLVSLTPFRLDWLYPSHHLFSLIIQMWASIEQKRL